MAAYMNNLFNYSRPLPEPFDKLKSKKVSVSSKYGGRHGSNTVRNGNQGNSRGMPVYEWHR